MGERPLIRVDRLEIAPYRRTLRKVFASSAARWEERVGALVYVGDGDGVGMGEAAPLPAFSRETLEAAVGALRAIDPATLEPCVDPQRVLSWIGRQVSRLPQNVPSARFALETALLDLAARRLGQPAWQLVGGRRRHLPLARVIEADPAQVRAAGEAGFGTVKVKLGRNPFSSEVEALWRLMEDRRLDWRLDVNRAWAVAGDSSGEELVRRVRVVSALGPKLIEEPGSMSVEQATRLQAPLALDETLAELDAEARDAWLDSGALRAVVLKPTLLGGVLPCLALARRAARRKVIAIASHTLEGPVGWAAVATLALGIDGSHAHGLGGHCALDVWETRPAALGGPVLQPWEEPGLGLPLVRP